VKPAPADMDLRDEIQKVALEWPAYGSRRITAELKARGWDVNRKRVQRLMTLMGLEGLHPGPRTTIAAPDARAYPYLLRDRVLTRVDEVWSSDITYVPIGESGFVYFATVIDLFSGRLVGWSITEHMRAELVQGALAAAVAGRGGNVDGVIFHTDRGSQYTSFLVAEYCRDHGIRRSMGRRGVCWDNAAAESFFSNFKLETLYELETRRFADIAEARREIFRWIAWYNHRRRHSRADYLSPVDYENRYHSTSNSTDHSATLIPIAA